MEKIPCETHQSYYLLHVFEDIKGMRSNIILHASLNNIETSYKKYLTSHLIAFEDTHYTEIFTLQLLHKDNQIKQQPNPTATL